MKHLFTIQTILKITFSIPKEAPVVKMKERFTCFLMLDVEAFVINHAPFLQITKSTDRHRHIVSDLYIQMPVCPGD